MRSNIIFFTLVTTILLGGCVAEELEVLEETGLSSPEPAPVITSAPIGGSSPTPAPTNNPLPTTSTPEPVTVPVSTPEPITVPVSTPEPITVPVSTPEPITVPVSTPEPITVPVSTPEPVVATPVPVPTSEPMIEVQLNRESWTLNASTANNLNNAIDGNLASRWTTRQPQSPGQWLTIDFGAEQTFNQIILDSQASENDSPVAYSVFVSNNSNNWGDPILTSAGDGGLIEINLEEQNAQFVRIEQVGESNDFWWSIHELNIYWKPSVTVSPPLPVVTPIPVPVVTPVPVATLVPAPIATAIPTPVPAPVATAIPTPVPAPIATPVVTPVPTPVPVNTIEGRISEGKVLYDQQCASCHGVEGGGPNPLNIDDHDVASMQLSIEETMPFGAPGLCDAQCAADTTAYIFAELNQPQVVNACSVNDSQVGNALFRRLNGIEYDNTVKTLLGITGDYTSIVRPVERAGFISSGSALSDSTELSAYTVTAQELAQLGIDSAPDLVGVDMDNEGEVLNFIDQFGLKAFRRPLTISEVNEYFDLYSLGSGTEANTLTPSSGDQCDTTLQCTAQFGNSATDCADSQSDQSICMCGNSACSLPSSSNGNGRTGVEWVISAILASPKFLYHIEAGEPNLQANGLRALSQYERASRLSYFLTGSFPDDVLFEAAANNQLQTTEQIRTQARRIVNTSSGADTVAEFVAQWLDVSSVNSLLTERLKTFDSSEANIDDYLSESVFRTVKHWLEQGGTIGTMFTASDYVVNKTLAESWGLSNVPSNDNTWQAVNVEERRSGILTHPAVMAIHSSEEFASATLRGAMMYNDILCRPELILPDDQDALFPNISEPLATNRQTLSELHAESPGCAGCHNVLDPLGFAFENYASNGTFRTEEMHAPHPSTVVDASGTSIVDGSSFDYSDARGYMQVIAESTEIQACFNRQVFRFALQRSDMQEDACSLQQFNQSLPDSNASIEDVFVEATTIDAFLFINDVQ